MTEVRGELCFGPPKTRASRRRVGLPQAVTAELARHLGTPGVADEFVFTANPKEVSARAGQCAVSFTLYRYGHLYPEADAVLRSRLDAFYVTVRRPLLGGSWSCAVERMRPQRGPKSSLTVQWTLTLGAVCG